MSTRYTEEFVACLSASNPASGRLPMVIIPEVLRDPSTNRNLSDIFGTMFDKLADDVSEKIVVKHGDMHDLSLHHLENEDSMNLPLDSPPQRLTPLGHNPQAGLSFGLETL
eukprot:879384-Amorphochlora_amoeboformis.AAC.1